MKRLIQFALKFLVWIDFLIHREQWRKLIFALDKLAKYDKGEVDELNT